MRRVEARRFSQAYLSGMRLVPQVTPSGIVLPPALSIPQDGLRVINVVIRIVKGLYFHETGRRLPSTHQVIPYDELACRNLPLNRANEGLMIRMLIQDLSTTAVKRVGGVFSYHWALHPSDPTSSMWLLDFFDGIRFFCKSAPTGNNLLLPLSALPRSQDQRRPIKATPTDGRGGPT